jgi:predicted GNAT family acetyltransferase
MGLLASAALTGGSMILGNVLNKRAQDRAFEQNKQFWQERFDTEAKYNSPVEQKARMQAAGLNPALMYKSGAGGGGNVSSPSAQGKIAERYELGQLALQSAQVAKIKEDTEKVKVEKDFISSKTEGQGTSNKIAIQDLAIKEIDKSNASEKQKLQLQNLTQDYLNKVEQYNTQVQKTGVTAEQRKQAENLNYEFDKLKKSFIDVGIDRDSGIWQTIKMFLMNTTQPAQLPLGEMWRNMMTEGVDVYGVPSR